MEAVFLKLLNMSISAGWLVLAVVVLRLMLKKAPKWIACLLWALVAVRLICPVTIKSMFSLIPSAETVPQDIMVAQKPMIHSGINSLNSIVNPVLSESLSPGLGDSVNPMQVIVAIASVLWLLGLLSMLVYAWISYKRIHKRISASIKIDDNIYICDYIQTPFILGIIKPRIYIPSTLGADKVAYVMAHERAHLQRHDHLWKPLGFALLSVYWFHPIMWIAYILLCRDIELACDERVIKELGEEDKKSYSDALLFCSVPGKLIVACPLAFGEVGVKERVKTVLNYKKPAFWVIVAAIAACVVVAVCFLTNPKEKLLHAPEPFCHSYYVKELLYDNSVYSSTYPIEGRNIYSFSSDYAMYYEGQDEFEEANPEGSQPNWMKEIKLTEENFDDYFVGVEGVGWLNGLTAKKVRRNNKAAWEVLTEEGLSYYLLQQKNGEVYLACWYYDKERETDPHSDDSSMRFLLQLQRADYITCTVNSPGESAFYGMKWYPEGDVDWLQEELPTKVLRTEGTLVFQVDDNADNLYIEEAYYEGEGDAFSLVRTGNYTMRPNAQGEVNLDVNKRNAEGEDFAIYTVAYKDGVYVIKVVFSEEGEVYDTVPPILMQDPLEIAIHEAILKQMAPREPDELFRCENHVILDTVTEHATKLTTVYAMVLTQIYDVSDGAVKDKGGSHMPVAITFEVGEEGEYTLKEYWMPEDGSYYVSSIREKFPDHIEENAIDTQKYIYGQIVNCYEQAVRYANLDTDAIVEGLLAQMVENPGTGSDVASYIQTHHLTYRELRYYGKYTLQYCFKEFLKGGQTDLRGALMAELCRDIGGIYGEALLMDYEPENGQEWFEEFRANAEVLDNQYTRTELAQYYPMSYVLLEVLSPSPENLRRVYAYRGENKWGDPGVILNGDGTFTFTFSMISSYIGVGTYTEKDDRLTLYTDDGQYVYVFDIIEDNLVFDADASSSMTWFADIPDGAVFE